jgi:hypothetical protein
MSIGKMAVKLDGSAIENGYEDSEVGDAHHP